MNAALDQYLPMLGQMELFRGIDAGELGEMLTDLDGRIVEYERKETIYRIGETVREAGVVLMGTVMAEDLDAEGDSVNIAMFRADEEFGADLAFSGLGSSPVRFYAATRCRVLMFSASRLMDSRSGKPAERTLLKNLVERLAGRCANLYLKVRIYGKRRIRSRIRIYLMSLEPVNGEILLPMNRTALAEWLGVDRAALARELGRMEADGLIALNKRRVRILDRDYFQPETVTHEE